MTYLGIDIGTSGVKALLIDRAGSPLGEATAKAVEPIRPHPGWSEQNPADWWTATLEAIDKLSKAHPAEMAKVRGIGLRRTSWSVTPSARPSSGRPVPQRAE